MRLTAEDIYNKLVFEELILTKRGTIRFHLSDVDIIVKQRDTVGNIMQEWVEGWMTSKGIEFVPNPNTQMPPDEFLDPDNPTHNLLEIKAFNYQAVPAFDIASFNAYVKEIIEKPYMLHVHYLIFGYTMDDEGYVTINNVWLRKVWEISRPMEDWSINLQVKHNIVQKMRPGIWWTVGDVDRRRFKNFDSLENYLSAIEEAVYQNPETHAAAGTWLRRMKAAYNAFYPLSPLGVIPRWSDIKDNYNNR